ncbi:MAG: peptidoglycan-associated lipoprotein Pal [Gemmatimonadales bacterium]|nr:MAG: peptidoglycan-associated lipoprotein Pal [Gemmatimonadales bacterium]
MHYRRLLVVIAVLGAVTLAACRRDAPPPPAPPVEQEDPGPDLDSLRAWEDSVQRAAEAAAEAERMAQLQAEARATLEEMVFFEYDESRITPQAEQVLRQKVAILEASPQVRLRLEGHTDERGSGEYNQALGSRRAESVREFFVQMGVDANRFETTSYGEERPLVNRSDEEAWAQNRRVEFVITAGADAINPPSD